MLMLIRKRTRPAPVERRTQTPPDFRAGYQAGMDGADCAADATGNFKSGWSIGQLHHSMLKGW
jgi:hypothetical protein